MLYSREEALELGKPAAELPASPPAAFMWDWSDVEKLRQQSAPLTDLSTMGPIPDDIEEFEQEVTFRDGHKMAARIFRPKSLPATGVPLLSFFHGGGWMVLDCRQPTLQMRQLVSVFKIVAVSLPYRLSPEHPFPTPQLDAYDGLRWVVENARSLGADLEQGFLVGGSSAGGQLAAVTTQHYVQEQRTPKVTGLYLQIPYILDGSQVPEKYKEYYNSPTQAGLENMAVLNTKSLGDIQKHFKPDLKSDWHSPFNAAEPHKGMPPTFFDVAGADPLRDHSLIYEDALRDAGVKTRLAVVAGMPHGFAVWLQNVPQFVQLLNGFVTGFAWLLNRDEAEVKPFLL